MTTPPDPSDLLLADGPPVQPAADADQAALLDWAAAHPLERATIAKDGNGRYKAVPPGGTKAKGHTRVTTFAEALDDSEGLTVWRHRLLAEGIVSTDELVAAVRQACDAGDKSALSSHIAAALHQAGEKLKADIGSALHLAMEHAVAGTGERPPAPWCADVDAALAAMEAYGITAEACWIERVAYIADHELIGTIDLLVSGPWGDTLRVLDYKTGSSPERVSAGIQLPCYTRASHLWKLDGSGWELAPAIDQGTALICHIPAGTGEAAIVEVDAEAGWELASLAARVRTARSAPNVRALFTAGATAVADVPAAPAEPADEDRTAWMLERIKTIKDPGDRATLARQMGKLGIAKPPWTEADIDALAGIVAPLEPTFARPDPATPPPPAPAPEPTPAPALWTVDDDGAEPDEATENAVVAAFGGLTTEQRAVVGGWVRDGRTSGRPWAQGSSDRTARTVAVQAAAVAAVGAFWDDDDPDLLPRLVLASVIGEELQPGWRTGAVLGALTLEQAQRLHQTADAFAASEPDAVALCGRLVQAALSAA